MASPYWQCISFIGVLYTLLYAAIFYFILFIFSSFFMGKSEKNEVENVKNTFSNINDEEQPLLEGNI